MNFRILFCFLFMAQSFTLIAMDSSAQFLDGANKYCHQCLSPGLMEKKCGGCKNAYYCSQPCQKDAWPIHRIWCKRHERLTQSQLVLGENDWSSTYNSEQIITESFAIFSEVFKATLGLMASLYTKDTFFDQIASTHKIPASLLYQTLTHVVSTQVSKPVKRILVPGIGFLSASELAAIKKAFNVEFIFGFDIDKDAVESTVKVNPSLKDLVRVADGTLVETWNEYAHYNIDLVLFIHPVFCKIVEKKKEFNEIGQHMLANLVRYLPNSQVVMINKSESEVNAIVPSMRELGFKGLSVIDNKSRAFPCYPFVYNLVITSKLKISREEDISSMLSAVATQWPETIIALQEIAEQRYRYVVVAKSPLNIN